MSETLNREPIFTGETYVRADEATRDQLLAFARHVTIAKSREADRRDAKEEGFMMALRVLAAQAGKVIDADGGVR